MIPLLKNIYKKNSNFFNRFPGINSIKVIGEGNNTKLNKPMLKCSIEIAGRNNEVVLLQEGGMKNSTIYIDGNNNRVILEENVSIVNSVIYIEDNNNSIIIRKGTKIAGTTELACIEGTEIIIGEDCLFSSNIKLRTGDSHSILNEEGKRINPSLGIEIGNHVWIGNDVKILKGVKIGSGSIVGTGTVVTREIANPNVIIAGNPGKIVKQNIGWLTERI